MKYGSNILIGWLCSQALPVFANPYIVLDSFSYSEVVSIKEATEDWRGPINYGEMAFTHNWGELGATYKGVGVGVLQRYDFELEFTSDTAEFYHLVNNKEPLPIGKQYDLFLAAKHTYSEGVRLSYRHEFNKDLAITMGGSYLKGLKLTEGQFNGTAVAIAENDYDFAADVNYYYSEDILFERQVDAPDGQGYSLDLDLNWSFLSDYHVRLNVRDLVGRIYWTDAPNTTAVASNDIKEYDENGYVIYNPVLSGYETNRDFTQKLNPQINLQLGYRITSNVGLLAKVYSIKPENFYQLGGDYRINSSNRIHLLYMFESDAVSVGYHSRYINFSITSDSLDLNQAYTFGFTLSANIVFF